MVHMNSLLESHFEKAAMEFARQIDKEVMADLRAEALRSDGWIKSPISMKKFMAKSDWKVAEVAAWVHENIDGQFSILDNNEIWFKEERHASMFSLRWA